MDSKYQHRKKIDLTVVFEFSFLVELLFGLFFKYNKFRTLLSSRPFLLRDRPTLCRCHCWKYYFRSIAYRRKIARLEQLLHCLLSSVYLPCQSASTLKSVFSQLLLSCEDGVAYRDIPEIYRISDIFGNANACVPAYLCSFYFFHKCRILKSKCKTIPEETGCLSCILVYS